MDADRAKDKIRSGAYELAATKGKVDAAKFLREMASRLDEEAWSRS